jgi:outer membrane protein assembly factor BamB
MRCRLTRALAAILGCAGASVPIASSQAADWPQFRGIHRDGCSEEKGLLKDWPAEGPALLWQIAGIGAGYSSPSIAGGKIFVMGGWKEGEYVLAIDLVTRKELWRTRAGPLWDKSVSKDPHGDGPCCTPTVDGNQVICSPGARDAVAVALDRKTGEVIWKTALPDSARNLKIGAAYASCVVTFGRWPPDSKRLACTPKERSRRACTIRMGSKCNSARRLTPAGASAKAGRRRRAQ